MYWKKLAINMHLVSQFLFVLSTIWDFFLTTIVHSARTGIFDIIPGLAIFVIGPWIIIIFILSLLLLIASIVTEDRLVVRHDKYGYAMMIIIYAILLSLALINPLISWPLTLNYLVNVFWAASLVCFKSAIVKGR